jgi:hypothetical protein
VPAEDDQDVLIEAPEEVRFFFDEVFWTPRVAARCIVGEFILVELALGITMDPFVELRVGATACRT